MDFIIDSPNTIKIHDSIMVVIEKISKVANFIPIKSTFKVINIVEISMRDVSILQGMPKTVISYCDVKFISKFWKGLFEGMGTKLKFSIAYHPQTNG